MNQFNLPAVSHGINSKLEVSAINKPNKVGFKKYKLD